MMTQDFLKLKYKKNGADIVSNYIFVPLLSHSSAICILLKYFKFNGFLPYYLISLKLNKPHWLRVFF